MKYNNNKEILNSLMKSINYYNSNIVLYSYMFVMGMIENKDDHEK